MSTAVNDALSGYKHFMLPNLSMLREPSPSVSLRHTTSVPVVAGCTDQAILVALAICLGAYCATRDVLLGWHDAESAKSVRICWDNLQSWEEVLERMIVTNITDKEVCRILDLNENQDPYVAVYSQDATLNHPLVVCHHRDVLKLWTSTLHFHPTTASVLANQMQVIVAYIVTYKAESPRNLSFLPISLQSAYDQPPPGSEIYTHLEQATIVTDYVSRHARCTPSLPAVQYFPELDLETFDPSKQVPETLTYAELDARSNQFAQHLLALGLNAEDRVAVCLLRDLDFHVCLLGIMKAGGCYVPIDPELPEERQTFIIEDSQARFVFTSISIASHLRDMAQYPTDDINVAHPDSLAYLLYTSGTTGTPKGCLLTHRGFSEAILALSWFACEADAQDGRYLAVASVAFDVHLAETFVAFAGGMTLISANRSQLLEDLPKWIRVLHITHVGIVPSLIEATMVAVEESPGNGRSMDDGGKMKLRYLASGGEKMSDSILQKWTDHPQVKLANFYGPSEVTIGCAARFMSHTTNKENIGQVFANCSGYVVDENLELVMRGALGELLVAAPLVGRGYHGKPELTEKAFVKWKGKWAYRTGDLVRMMPDSTLEIIGRIDTQIKLRGVRIESEGISNILRRAASVYPGLNLNADVSTVLAQHPLLQTQQLVSFIALDSSASIARRRSSKPQVLSNAPKGLLKFLKEACVRELASYMRPSHIIPITFLPLNPNGKTDNKVLVSVFQETALGAPGVADGSSPGTGASASFSRSLNVTEAVLVDIVAQQTAVPRDQLGPSSHLFELGYDSMKVILLASRLRTHISTLSSPITAGELMKTPTVEAIATLIDERCRFSELALPTLSESKYVETFAQEWKAEVDSAIDPGLVESVLPTFPVQDGILYRSAGSDTLYVQHVMFRCKQGVLMENLRTAWHAVMIRHEILRTTFLFSKAIIQIVLRPDACQLPWQEQCINQDIDSNFSTWFLETEASKISSAINKGISSMPPFRLKHFFSNKASFVTLSIHHSIYDGISLPHLLKDIEHMYTGYPVEPSRPLGQVLDEIHSVDLEKAHTFWRSVFEGFDWSRTSHQLASGTEARQISVRFNADLPNLENLANSRLVTLQALLMSAFAMCLGRYLYKRDDVVFGVIRSGRSISGDEFQDAQCPMISVLPSRIHCSNKDGLLQAVQRDIGDTIDFEHVSLSKIQQWIQPGKTLFETLFSISLKADDKAELWDILKSTQPQPDYFLAVEIVIDRTSGEVIAHAAYTDEDVSTVLVSHLLENIESAALSLAQRKDWHFSPSIDKEKSGQWEVFGGQPSYDENLENEADGPSDPELEDRLWDVIARYLNLDLNQVPSTTSLISLGLDSITSIGLSRKLKAEGMSVTAVELMGLRTIRHLARFFQHHSESPFARDATEASTLLARSQRGIAQYFNFEAAKLDDSDVVNVYPATALQSGMLSQTISSSGQLYVHAFPFKLSDRIDYTRLKHSWRCAVNSFAILRTSFHFLLELGCWVQAIHSVADFKWTESRISGQTDFINSTADFIDYMDLSAEEAFSRPPVKFLLLHRDSSTDPNSRLVVLMHHALYDGISISKLSKAVMDIYEGEKSAAIPQFHDLLPYFEYQQLHGTTFWAHYLEGYHGSQIPRSSSAISYAGAYTGAIDIPLSSDEVQNASRRFYITPQCIGQAAWAKSLAVLMLNRDVVFGHVVSGRNVDHAEEVIGPMLNTIPCRVHFSPDVKNIDLLQIIHRKNSEALHWQHASLRAIQKELGTSALFDSIFLFQPSEGNANTERTIWNFDGSDSDDAKVQYALSVEVHDHRDHLTIRAACRYDVIPGDAFNSVLYRFRKFFITFLEQPGEYAINDMPEVDGGYDMKPRDQVQQVIAPTSHHPMEWDPDNLFIRDILQAISRVPIDQIQLDTSLVSLGIDSISAIQLAFKCRQVGMSLSAADILLCEVVSDLLQTSVSRKNQNSKVYNSDLRIPSSESRDLLRRLAVTEVDTVEGVKPISAGMKWLIGAWQRSERSRFQYAFVFHLPSVGFDIDKLRQAWIKLIDRHEILRSTFASSPGSAKVRMITFTQLPADRRWSEYCLDNIEDREIAVMQYMRNLVDNPLSTDRPPARAVLLRTSDHKYLVLHLHHFQYDAWSLSLLLGDLTRLYHGDTLSNTNSNALTKFLQFAVSSNKRKEQEIYWSKHFPLHYEPILFPSLVTKNVVNPGQRTLVIEAAAISHLSALQERARLLSVPLNAVFLACWARVQASYTKGKTVAFGLWQLGRSGGLESIESLAVPCMNVLPIYLSDLSSSTLDIAFQIQSELRRRTPIVEQSDLEDIDRWIRGDGKPLCNVYVNIVTETLHESECQNIFSPVMAPYYIPEIPVPYEQQPSVDRLPVTDLIQDDLMIDIFSSSLEQTVGMTVECDTGLMDIEQARILMSTWSTEVRKTLDI